MFEVKCKKKHGAAWARTGINIMFGFSSLDCEIMLWRSPSNRPSGTSINQSVQMRKETKEHTNISRMSKHGKLHWSVLGKYRNLHRINYQKPKIFSGAYGLSKHLPVFILGTENVMGWWVAIVVVVCGKICGKIEKLLDQNKIWCGTRYGSKLIMIVVTKDKQTKRQKDKRQKGKKAKRQKGKNAKGQKDKKTKRHFNTL